MWVTISVSRAVCAVVVRVSVEGAGVIFWVGRWVDLDKIGRLDWRVKRSVFSRFVNKIY